MSCPLSSSLQRQSSFVVAPKVMGFISFGTQRMLKVFYFHALRSGHVRVLLGEWLPMILHTYSAKPMHSTSGMSMILDRGCDPHPLTHAQSSLFFKRRKSDPERATFIWSQHTKSFNKNTPTSIANVPKFDVCVQIFYFNFHGIQSSPLWLPKFLQILPSIPCGVEWNHPSWGTALCHKSKPCTSLKSYSLQNLQTSVPDKVLENHQINMASMPGNVSHQKRKAPKA